MSENVYDSSEKKDIVEKAPEEISSKTLSCLCKEKTDGENYERVPIIKRLKSWPVWVALFGALGIILNSSGVFEKWGLDTEGWNAIVNAVGAVFIALGVVNNPTDAKHF